MAKSKSGRGGTGAKPANQGKLITNPQRPAVKGTTTGNGNWDANSHCSENVSTPVIRGSKKSF